MTEVLSFPHFSAVPKDQWPWENFTPQEMACRESGMIAVAIKFMHRLQRTRNTFAQAMHVTSGYRSPEYNRKVSKTGFFGPHTTGRAVDIRVYGEAAFRLVRIALAHGFTGIGIKQKGPHHLRFIHLDELESKEASGEENPGRKRPWIWSY